MRRRLLNFLTALSLALCVAVGALWLWSYQHPVLFGVAGNSVEASRGWIYVNDLAGQMMLALRRRIPPEPLNLVWRRTPENSNTGQRFALPMASVPYWLLALPTGAMPAWRLARRLLRHSSVDAGLCIACGYDLRASKDRCPECGTLIRPTP